MFSLIKYLVVIVLAGLLVGGVMKIEFYPDQLTQAPGRIVAVATDKATLEKIRGPAVNLKRLAELWLIKDEAQKIGMAVGYIKTDATRLDLLMNEKAEQIDAVLPQAELLLVSIERASSLAATVAPQQLADVSLETKEAFGAAENTLQKLRLLESKYAALQERFTHVKSELTKYVGDFRALNENKEDVAGVQSQAPAPAPSTKIIPLTF